MKKLVIEKSYIETGFFKGYFMSYFLKKIHRVKDFCFFNFNAVGTPLRLVDTTYMASNEL